MIARQNRGCLHLLHKDPRMRMTLALSTLLVAAVSFGCASSPRTVPGSDSALAKRAAALRGATDAQWEAIRYGHDQGKRYDSVYVFTIAELRMGALRAQTMAVIGTA